MFSLAQMIQFDVATMAAGAGALGMSLLVWLLRSRVETAETTLRTAVAESNETRVALARIETQLSHHGDRLKRLERDE